MHGITPISLLLPAGGCQVQDEKGLVEQAKRGDTQALARLYEEYFDRIYRYIAIRVGSRADAEDLAGQVFLKMLESISSFKWRGVPFSAWLFRIAHNLAVDHLRQKAKKGHVVLDESMAISEIDPAALAEIRLGIEQLNIALEQLTKNQKEVMALRFGAGLSTAETARVVGKSEGAVKALQHSALVALRKRLSSWRKDE
jgi:RNA polymerase sigma-70 factor (ECF subfamily)